MALAVHLLEGLGMTSLGSRLQADSLLDRGRTLNWHLQEAKDVPTFPQVLQLNEILLFHNQTDSTAQPLSVVKHQKPKAALDNAPKIAIQEALHRLC